MGEAALFVKVSPAQEWQSARGFATVAMECMEWIIGPVSAPTALMRNGLRGLPKGTWVTYLHYKATLLMKGTKGQAEAEICEAIIKFEKEYMGRGPLETKAYILDDIVLVRLKNVLTQAELKLAEAPGVKDGCELIKRVRIALIEQGRPLLQCLVEEILGVKVRSLHTDISTVTGERVILFSLVSAPVFARKS